MYCLQKRIENFQLMITVYTIQVSNILPFFCQFGCTDSGGGVYIKATSTVVWQSITHISGSVSLTKRTRYLWRLLCKIRGTVPIVFFWMKVTDRGCLSLRQISGDLSETTLWKKTNTGLYVIPMGPQEEVK